MKNPEDTPKGNVISFDEHPKRKLELKLEKKMSKVRSQLAELADKEHLIDYMGRKLLVVEHPSLIVVQGFPNAEDELELIPENDIIRRILGKKFPNMTINFLAIPPELLEE